MATRTTLPPLQEWPAVIVFGGSDILGREKVKEQMFELLHKEHKSYQDIYYDSSRESFEDFLLRAITPTLFGDFRLFHLPHAQKLSDKERARLAEVLPQVSSDVLVLVEYDSRSQKTEVKASFVTAIKLAKLVDARIADHYVFEQPRRHELPQWLSEKVKTLFHRRMDEMAGKLLIDYVGEDVGLLYSELQKLDIYLPDGAPITAEAINVVTGLTAHANPYDLADALGQRNWKNAQAILDNLLRGKAIDILPLCAIFYRHFWNLYKIRCYAEKNSAYALSYFNAQYARKSDIAYTIGLACGVMNKTQKAKSAYPIMVLPDTIGQSRNYARKDIIAILVLLTTYDRQAKDGTAAADEKTLRQLCYTIIRTGKGRGA